MALLNVKLAARIGQSLTRHEANPNLAFVDIETRYLGALDAFSEEAKRKHEVFSFQYKIPGQRAKWEVVDPTKFLRSSSSAATEEARLLNKVNQIASSHKALVGWNSKFYDFPVIGHRMEAHGIPSQLGSLSQIDLQVLAQRAFKRTPGLSAARPFSLESFSTDLLGGFSSKKQALIQKRFGGDFGKVSLRLRGKEVEGKDIWKLLGDPEGFKLLKKYGLRDAHLLEFIEQETNLVANYLDPRIPLKLENLKRMRRYDQADRAAKFFSKDLNQGARIQITSPSTLSRTPFSKWMREEEFRNRAGFQVGDVAWVTYPEELVRQGKRKFVGAQIRYQGFEHRFDFRSDGERVAFQQLTRRVAEEIGDVEVLRGLKNASHEKVMQRLARVQSRKLFDKVQAVSSLGSAELSGLAKLEDHISTAVRNVKIGSKIGALRRVAPYAAGLLVGLDVLSSKEKAGPVWGLAAGGLAAFLTKGMPGLSRMATIGTAYILSRTIANSITKGHQGSLPGFEEQGEGPIMRSQLTDFGSGWDPFRRIAAKLGRGFEEFLSGPGFRKRLEIAARGAGKEIGAGAFGKAEVFETIIAGQKSKFVKKTYFAQELAKSRIDAIKIMESEKKGLDILRNSAGPTIYGSGVDEGGNPFLLMEFIEGSSVASRARKGISLTGDQMSKVRSAIKEIHTQGLYHGDLKFENLMVVEHGPAAGEIAIIDPMTDRFVSKGSWGERINRRLGQAQDILCLRVMEKYQSKTAGKLLASASNAVQLGIFPNFPKAYIEQTIGVSEKQFVQARKYADLIFEKAGIPGYSYEMEKSLQGTIEIPYTREALFEEVSRHGLPLKKANEMFARLSKFDLMTEGYKRAKDAGGLWRTHINEILGFHNVGVSGGQRKVLTDFGSRWDAVKALRRVLNVKTIEEVIAHPEFIRAMEQGEVVEELGKGAMGTVARMRSKVKGQTFEYARKQYFDVLPEKDVMEAMASERVGLEALKEAVGASETIGAPNVYAITKARIGKEIQGGKNVHTMYMEYIAGAETLNKFSESGGRLTRGQIHDVEKTYKRLHALGYQHTDTTGANVLVDKQGRISILDPMPNRTVTARRNTPRDIEYMVVQEVQDNMAVESLKRNKGKVVSSELREISDAPTIVNILTSHLASGGAWGSKQIGMAKKYLPAAREIAQRAESAAMTHNLRYVEESMVEKLGLSSLQETLRPQYRNPASTISGNLRSREIEKMNRTMAAASPGNSLQYDRTVVRPSGQGVAFGEADTIIAEDARNAARAIKEQGNRKRERLHQRALSKVFSLLKRNNARVHRSMQQRSGIALLAEQETFIFRD